MSIFYTKAGALFDAHQQFYKLQHMLAKFNYWFKSKSEELIHKRKHT